MPRHLFTAFNNSARRRRKLLNFPKQSIKPKQLNSNLEVDSSIDEMVTYGKCPFMYQVKHLIKKVNHSDIIDLGSMDWHNMYNYDDRFDELLRTKIKDHTYQVFKKVNRLAETPPHALEYTYGEKKITVWCSNDYLGMSRHPEVLKAAREALEKYGSGSGGTRDMSGNSLLHENLEHRLAELHRKPSALLFLSCYQANESTLSILAKSLPGCHVFSDEANHTSIIQGICKSGATKHIYRHNDPDHLEQLLKTVSDVVINEFYCDEICFN